MLLSGAFVGSAYRRCLASYLLTPDKFAQRPQRGLAKDVRVEEYTASWLKITLA